jgi:hypothetical protein
MRMVMGSAVRADVERVQTLVNDDPECGTDLIRAANRKWKQTKSVRD